jgi:hypothetical protein
MNLGNIRAPSSFVHDGQSIAGNVSTSLTSIKENEPQGYKNPSMMRGAWPRFGQRKGMPMRISQKPFIVEIRRRRRRRPVRLVDRPKGHAGKAG